MESTNTTIPNNKKKNNNRSRNNSKNKNQRESPVLSTTDTMSSSVSATVAESIPKLTVAERVNSIETKQVLETKKLSGQKLTGPSNLAVDTSNEKENNIFADSQDPVVSFSDNSRSFQIKSPTDGPFQPTSPDPSAIAAGKQLVQEFSTGFSVETSEEGEEAAVTCENFVKHPIQETAKVASKIVGKLSEMQTNTTFRSIAQNSTWADTLISDSITDEKDPSSSSSSSSSSKSLSSSPTTSSTSLLRNLLTAICYFLRQFSIMLLGTNIVISLENTMTPMPSSQASCGNWVGWIMGTVIGFYALFLAKCMEIFVYLLMAPARIAQSIHINTIKLIVRLLENTPGGVRVLKALNGYVSTDATVHTE